MLYLWRSARFVEALVQSYEESKGQTMFYFFVKVVERLGSSVNDAPLEGLVNLLSHGDGVEANKAVRMFSYFIKWYSDQNGGKTFSWDKSGHLLLKHLVRAEGLRGGSALLSELSPAEISSFVKLAGGALDSMGTTTKDKADILEKVARYLLDEMTSVIPSQDKSENTLTVGADTLQTTAARIDSVFLTESSKKSLHDVISRLNAPMQSLEGIAVSPLIRQQAIASLATFIVARGPQLLTTFQATGTSEPDFFRQMVLGLIPAGPSLGDNTWYQLKSFVTDKRVGLIDGHLYWEEQIKNPQRRMELVERLGVLARASKTQWLDAVREFSHVFGKMHRFVAFMAKKLEWKDQDLAVDYSSSLGMLVRISSAENYVLARQVSLLERWFERKNNVKETNSGF